MDKGSPSVTIGLLVFNGEAYLSEAVDSILAQTYDDFELIISDNASTDATQEICRSYERQDSRVRYVRQAKNIGAFGNFNFLVSEARGEFFKWAAADDLITPMFLERCIDVLRTNGQYVLCHTKTATIGVSGEDLPNDIILSSGAAEDISRAKRRDYPPWRRFYDVLLGNTAVMDLWGVMRTDTLRKSGLLENYVGCEKVFMATLCLKGRFAEIPEKLFSYRIHPNQFSSLASSSARQRWANPNSKYRYYLRMQYLRGYFLAILNSDVSATNRALCLLAILRYLFQVSKWVRIVKARIIGAKLSEGNETILRINGALAETIPERDHTPTDHVR